MNTLDPTLDIVFKLLFGGPKSQGILISLLTAVLQPTSPITQVTILNPEVSKHNVGDKGIELDLLVHLEDGTQANIEMQARSKTAFRNRAMYYWARTYANQLHKGDLYLKLKPVVIIIFTGYRELANNRLHSIFHVLEIHDHIRFQDAFALHLVELPRIDDPDAVAEAVPAVRRWARFLGAHTDEERSEVAKEDPMVNEAQTMLQELSSDEAVRRLAEEREIALKFWEMELQLTREKEREQGREEGREEGRAETILQVLSARGIELTTEDRTRLLACRERSVLDKLVLRALTLESGEDLFEDQPDERSTGK
jgi:predicted transposase/invertase (TIGR01784 family)